MASVNKVTLIGNLGKDPELKYTPSGNAVCQFSIATSEHWTDKSGQKQQNTTWHNIVVWGKTAENASKYLKKGRPVYIDGKISNRSWEDKNGNKKYRTEVVATSLQFLGSGKESSDDPGPQEPPQSQEPPQTQQQDAFDQSPPPENMNQESGVEDDLPF